MNSSNRNQSLIILRKIRHVVLDMDGTIYSGRTLFPYIRDFLDYLGKLRIDYTFLTNNSSLSVASYIRKLRAMNLPVNRSQIYTSAQATINFLRQNYPSLNRVYLVGTRSLKNEFSANGFTIVETNQQVEPEAVVVGFDTTLSFQKLCRAAYWIKSGKLFIATHPDLICPTDQPTLLVDCGAVCAALEAATGRKPEKVLGKPDPVMIRGIQERHALKNDEIAMVGDRLYTDMEMARRAGIIGILVLSGETTRTDLQKSRIRPNFVLENVGELTALLAQSRQ